MRSRRILVAANQNAVTKAEGTETRVPASLAVFRIGNDGKLSFRAEIRRRDRAGEKSDVGGIRFVERRD